MQSTPVVLIQEEAFTAAWPEIAPHLAAHHAELIDDARLPLDVDVAAYAFMEAHGKLCLVTVRVDEVIQGYLLAFLHTHLHSQQVRCATLDVYYVAPAYRGSGLGGDLLRHAEALLRTKGVQRLYGGYTPQCDISGVLRRQGWVVAEVMYTKWMGD